jgi:uncharacterized protein (TIGR03435 family)
MKKRIVRIMARHVGRNMRLGGKLALAAAALLAVVVPMVLGWGQVQAAVVPLLHPKDGVRRAFEVATIKPSSSTAIGWQIQIGLSPFRMTNATAYELVRFAYGTTSDAQIVDAPNWLKTEHFDIQAKASDADVAAFNKLRGFDERDNMFRLLTQSLLEDRFQLKATIETRDLPAYALVVDKGGIKMKETDPMLDPRQKGFGSREPNVYRAGDESMSSFVDWLSICYETGGRPVVDQTGLNKHYDFVLRGVATKAPPAGDADASGTQAPTVSLFTALPEQLGLKIVPIKAPMEVLVIDHIEQPSPN